MYNASIHFNDHETINKFDLLSEEQCNTIVGGKFNHFDLRIPYLPFHINKVSIVQYKINTASYTSTQSITQFAHLP